MSGSSPLLQAAKLWEKTSGKGTRYMQGRLGGVKLVILPNRDYIEGDPVNGHTHNLFFQDGTSTAPKSAAANRAPAEKREPRPRPAPAGGSIDDDPMPF